MANPDPIKGSSRTGDFVLQSQQVAKKHGFRNVSRQWFDQTIGYEEALETMAEERATVDSFEVPFERMVPTVTQEGFCLEGNGRMYYPDDYALGQLGTALGIGRQYLLQLLPNRRPGDADALAYAIRHALARGGKPDRRFSLRVQDGNRLRAVLSPNAEWISDDSAVHISRRTEYILTYALSGFSNFGAIGIQIGGIGGLVPERRSDLARLGLRAMIGGALACSMTACIAGMLM